MVDIFAWMSAVRTALQYLHRGGGGGGAEETWSIRKIHSGTCPKQFNIKKKLTKKLFQFLFFLSVI